jgi:hypothetical protein
VKGRARRGDWVRIHRIILEPDYRAGNLPVDTRATPFQVWTNGFLDDESAKIGDQATIRTAIGRLLAGRLTDLNPRYAHDFGDPQSELLAAGEELRSLLNRP